MKFFSACRESEEAVYICLTLVLININNIRNILLTGSGHSNKLWSDNFANLLSLKPLRIPTSILIQLCFMQSLSILDDRMLWMRAIYEIWDHEMWNYTTDLYVTDKTLSRNSSFHKMLFLMQFFYQKSLLLLYCLDRVMQWPNLFPWHMPDDTNERLAKHSLELQPSINQSMWVNPVHWSSLIDILSGLRIRPGWVVWWFPKSSEVDNQPSTRVNLIYHPSAFVYPWEYSAKLHLANIPATHPRRFLGCFKWVFLT